MRPRPPSDVFFNAHFFCRSRVTDPIASGASLPMTWKTSPLDGDIEKTPAGQEWRVLKEHLDVRRRG